MKVYRGAVAALLLMSMFGCDGKGEPVPRASTLTVQGTTVVAVTAEALPETREAMGTVKARNSATIAARISGAVTGVYVQAGDRVGRGKLLAVIESTESGAQAAGAASGADEADRALDEARSRNRLATATLERYRNLFREQAVTRQEFETHLSEQEVASQAVARAQARLAQARQGARAAGAVAGYGRVTTPVSGVVVAKQVEAGQTVFPGTPLFTIEGDDGYRLEVAAPEGLAGRVKPGDRVGIAVEGAPGTGMVSEVVPLVDAASRTFTVKIDLPARGPRSGNFGKAFFGVGSRQGVAVPATAVVERGALTSVWAVSPEGIARLRLVKLGRILSDRVEVLSGLRPGDRIVTAGMDRVSDGARLR